MPFIKSFISYVGSKQQLLLELDKAFGGWGRNRNFVDLFAGSLSVSINFDRSEKIICNDACAPLMDLYEKLIDVNFDDVKRHVESRVEEFGLFQENQDEFKECYYNFRNFYNESEDSNILDLIILTRCCFNGIVKFKDDMSFAGTAGDKRITDGYFEILRIFMDKLHHNKGKIFFERVPLNDFKINTFSLSEGDIVYVDPPYFIAPAHYNRGWGEEQEEKLYNFLDELHAHNIRWVLSNVTPYNEKVHQDLETWIGRKNYMRFDVDASYNKFNRNNTKNSRAQEVIIMNI